MIKHFNSILLVLIISILLSACLNLSGTLNHKQIKLLKKEGFELTDDGWALGLPEPLLFEFNKKEFKPTYGSEIARLSLQLKKYNLDRIKIVGYTDDIGSANYNLRLSKERAQSVANIFLSNGFLLQNVEVIGRGHGFPLKPNNSEENRAINRRVAIIINP